MSWSHIRDFIKHLKGPALIIEDDEPRFVVLAFEDWKRLQREDVERGGRESAFSNFAEEEWAAPTEGFAGESERGGDPFPLDTPTIPPYSV